MFALPRGPHITRFSMYAHLGKVGRGFARRSGKILSVSHSSNLAEVLGIETSEIQEVNYPQHTLLSLPFPDESFDFVLSDQVLEHVEGSPENAVRECYRILKPGGVTALTTCLINPVHGAPRDFWRFTPDGLRWLHREWSETIDCGGWGNFEAWQVIRDGLRLDGVPLATWHPLHRLAVRNDPRWPISVWIVAKK
jgi:SAM-dependent methyltransferase